MRKALVAKTVLVVAVGILLTLPSIAGAVLSGANGRIAYISGRGGTDAEAKLYLRIASGSFGLGLNSGPFTGGTQQHRHPTWSPDRTKIAFARGDASCNPTKCDIFVIDLTAPFPFAENVTNTPTINEDRPAWSPDGTRIAYESEVAAQQDIIVQSLANGTKLNLTDTSPEVEGYPAWTPDSQRIYYAVGKPFEAPGSDIHRELANNSQATPVPPGPDRVLPAPGISEFQPSISPDGTQMCFTRQLDPVKTGTADVVTALSNGGGQADLSDNIGEAAANGDYNCTWSPDGQFVAYVRGTFSTGDLVMEPADDSSLVPVEIETAKGVFDGNPDWAPDGRPVCKDATVQTGFNQPVTIPIECLDSGPFYERTQVQESAPEKTANGTLSGITQGDQEPSTVTYTPNPGFSGKDTFQINSFDKVAGFGEPKTITVNVAPGPPTPKAPTVSNVKVTPRKAKAGAKLTVRWTLDEAAATTLVFKRAPKGKKGKRRFVPVGVANVLGQAGANALSLLGGRLYGRIGRQNGRKLAPGSYRVSIQARDADNLSSEVITSSFQIVPKKG